MKNKPSEQNRRVLVIDDNRATHDDFRRILCPPVAKDLEATESALFGPFAEKTLRTRFEVDSAYQGQEGASLIKHALEAGRPYAMAFVDVQMPPGWDGVETTRQILAIDPEIQIVICTAYSAYSWDEMFEQLGHSDGLLILKKPFDPVEAFQLARALTKKWSLHQQSLRKVEGLQNQFIEAQKMEVIGRLTGGVAHDFNNILAVIMGYSDMMKEALGPHHPKHHDAEEILQAAERAAALTRQLLVFSRKEILQPIVLDLNEVVGSVENMLRRLVDENIELTVLPGLEIGKFKADAGYVGQILMNLVVNARDAMPRGGKLSIKTSRVTLQEQDTQTHTGAAPGDYVVLSVTDTGTGMTDQVKARLFEALFTTKPKGKGTGLGLTTCQTIVQQSGGHIVVQSELGQGTSFQVYFPRVEQPLDISRRPGIDPMPRGTETLLVVEDEPTLRQMACVVLEAQGYNVLCASNGEDGLSMVREHKGQPIRLIITDVIMPQMDGNVMAELLKSAHPEMKFLFSSGYIDDAIAHHGVLEAGVAFLAKPYTPAALSQKVRGILDCCGESLQAA